MEIDSSSLIQLFVKMVSESIGSTISQVTELGKVNPMIVKLSSLITRLSALPSSRYLPPELNQIWNEMNELERNQIELESKRTDLQQSHMKSIMVLINWFIHNIPKDLLDKSPSYSNIHSFVMNVFIPYYNDKQELTRDVKKDLYNAITNRDLFFKIFQNYLTTIYEQPIKVYQAQTRAMVQMMLDDAAEIYHMIPASVGSPDEKKQWLSEIVSLKSKVNSPDLDHVIGQMKEINRATKSLLHIYVKESKDGSIESLRALVLLSLTEIKHALAMVKSFKKSESNQLLYDKLVRFVKDTKQTLSTHSMDQLKKDIENSEKGWAHIHNFEKSYYTEKIVTLIKSFDSFPTDFPMVYDQIKVQPDFLEWRKTVDNKLAELAKTDPDTFTSEPAKKFYEELVILQNTLQQINIVFSSRFLRNQEAKKVNLVQTVSASIDALQLQNKTMVDKIFQFMRYFAILPSDKSISYRAYMEMVKVLSLSMIHIENNECRTRKRLQLGRDRPEALRLDEIMCDMSEAVVPAPVGQEVSNDQNILGNSRVSADGRPEKVGAEHAELISYKSAFGDVYRRTLANRDVVIKVPKRLDFDTLIEATVGFFIMNNLIRNRHQERFPSVADVIPYYGMFSCTQTSSSQFQSDGRSIERANLPICTSSDGVNPNLYLVSKFIEDQPLKSMLTELTLDQYKESFRQIWSLLIILQQSCLQFTHNDAHLGNILVRLEEGNIRATLFDYGGCSFTLNGERVLGMDKKFIRYGIDILGYSYEIENKPTVVTGMVDLLQFFRTTRTNTANNEISTYANATLEEIIRHFNDATNQRRLYPFYSTVQQFLDNPFLWKVNTRDEARGTPLLDGTKMTNRTDQFLPHDQYRTEIARRRQRTYDHNISALNFYSYRKIAELFFPDLFPADYLSQLDQANVNPFFVSPIMTADGSSIKNFLRDVISNTM